ncbi:double-strand break repair protein MRE11, putative [Plasmodium sp. DRC-Itaito]|nr:double-strand break repair protein MRE11, putative [Plasmodium sp. DRC-Itaito]
MNRGDVYPSNDKNTRIVSIKNVYNNMYKTSDSLFFKQENEEDQMENFIIRNDRRDIENKGNIYINNNNINDGVIINENKSYDNRSSILNDNNNNNHNNNNNNNNNNNSNCTYNVHNINLNEEKNEKIYYSNNKEGIQKSNEKKCIIKKRRKILYK